MSTGDDDDDLSLDDMVEIVKRETAKKPRILGTSGETSDAIPELDGEVEEALANAKAATDNPEPSSPILTGRELIYHTDRNDPAKLGWPPTLPMEIALRTGTPEELKAIYKFTDEEWVRLMGDPRFQKDVDQATEMLRAEGMTFKTKAKLQAEELLQTAWHMIHDKSGAVPPQVKADLMKFVIRVAGYDASAERSSGPGNNLQINIQLNG